MLFSKFLISSSGNQMSNWINVQTTGVPYTSVYTRGILQLSTGDVIALYGYGQNHVYSATAFTGDGDFKFSKVLDGSTSQNLNGTFYRNSSDQILIGSISGTAAVYTKFSSNLSSTVYSQSIGTTSPVSYAGRPIGQYELSNGNLVAVSAYPNEGNVTNKTTPTGAINWSTRYIVNSLNMTIRASCIDSNENLYVLASYTESTLMKVVLLKIVATTGAVTWNRTIAHTSSVTDLQDYSPNQVVVDSSGDVYVAMQYSGANKASLIKISSSNVVQWQREATTSAITCYPSLAVDMVNNYIYWTFQDTANSQQIFKYDTSGNLIFKNYFSYTGGTASYRATGGAISVANDGDILFLKSVELPTSVAINLSCIIIAKLPSDGTGTATYSNLVYAVSSVSVVTTTSLTYSTATITTSNANYSTISNTKVFNTIPAGKFVI